MKHLYKALAVITRLVKLVGLLADLFDQLF